MKRKLVAIPATITTRTCLRLFYVGSSLFYHRFLPYDVEDYYYDIPLRSNTPPTHEEVLRRIKLQTTTDKVIIAYQIVVTSTLQQTNNGVEGHPIMEPSIILIKLIGKKVFIVGKIITRTRVKKLHKWLKTELKKDPSRRDKRGLERRDISVFFNVSAKKFLRQRRLSKAIKMGAATLIPFDEEIMELRTR